MTSPAKAHFLSALGGALLGGVVVATAVGSKSAASSEDAQRMGHLVVERLDIVEPDGTLRQALYSKARDPGIVVRGQTYPHPSRTQSGMLFYNDEGTEVGGLVYAGERGEDGTPTSGGALSFDAYEQDQIVQVIGVREGDRQYSGVLVNDRPLEPMDFDAMQSIIEADDPDEVAHIAERANLGGASRGFFGRASDKSSQVALRDGEGRLRLIMQVSEDGEANIRFLDEEGATVRTIAP